MWYYYFYLYIIYQYINHQMFITLAGCYKFPNVLWDNLNNQRFFTVYMSILVLHLFQTFHGLMICRAALATVRPTSLRASYIFIRNASLNSPSLKTCPCVPSRCDILTWRSSKSAKYRWVGDSAFCCDVLTLLKEQLHHCWLWTLITTRASLLNLRIDDMYWGGLVIQIVFFFITEWDFLTLWISVSECTFWCSFVYLLKSDDFCCIV